MANNRLFIRNRKTGEFTSFLKSFGDGWEIRKTAEQIEIDIKELWDDGAYGNCYDAVTDLELVAENDPRYKEVNGLLLELTAKTMTYDKRIATHQWGGNLTHDEFTNSNGIVMAANHYRHDIAFIDQLAAEAKLDFPALKVEEIEVFAVTKSRYNQGFWGVRFPLPAGTVKDGYRVVESLDFSFI
jgi:hypothetical protein